MNKRNRVATLIVLVFALILGCVAYIEDYYRAEDVALECIENPKEGIEIYETDKKFVFEPENAEAGLIFYPGGKVQCEAYAPLMEACAQRNILCILVEMPANLAVLDVNAADGIQEEFPDISKWYIGGHSLGGSMAASYLGEHAEEYDGLILLGSYSTENLRKTDLNVLSIYGSNDKLLNAEKYEENRSNLPDDFKELVIEGGCHAYFGSYGAQEGDGQPTISNEEQVQFTVDAIESFAQ